MCIIDQRTLRRLSNRGITVFLHPRITAKRHRRSQQHPILAVIIDNRHFVLCQRTGLVRADDLRAAERFHRCQLTNDRILLAHIGHADGKHDRHDRCQTLRYRRDS